METQDFRAILRDAYRNWDGQETLEDKVIEWANCTEATVDSDGDVWISHPQSGHWLGADELVELVGWLRLNNAL